MSIENPKFENPSIPPAEKHTEIEKVVEEKEKFEPVTPEDMESWQKLKTADFRLVARGAFPENPERQEIRESLKPIEEKRILEKEKLTGPTFDREGFLTASEKQKDYVNFLKSWDQLGEKEQFDRLNRVGNELKNMRPSTEEDQSKLRGNITLQEKVTQNYSKIVEEAKPLSKKEDDQWQELLQKYESRGLPSFFGKELKRFEELQGKGQLEAEKLIGPHLADFEILASSSLRRDYLIFLENWNKLDPKEQRDRIERAGDIADRLERERQVLVGVGPADPLPRKRIFEKVRNVYLQKKENKG